ncbi:PKD domain protein [Confluentibacter sediminis]|uniref:PKD domain protein n=1 Tax=Confluentibacter sediminis TaxID=2219045 RepID=UPI000DABAA3E|nr:PKD domain protein [Confluentibacter sediminis]
MKTLKYIVSLSIVLIVFINCTQDDNDLSFVDNVVAPSNVSALFQITQDNSGSVTITPSAEGAVSYNIILGDNSETIKVKQGLSAEHVYAEGSYTVKIEAIGITGLKSEVTKDIVVSFKAPENLVVDIENDAALSKQVNVTATADYAMSFEVYFGEPGHDDPVIGNIGEAVSYTYEEAGTYTIRVVAMGGAIETTEYTQEFEVTAILQPIVKAATPPRRDMSNVISIYSDAYTSISGVNFYPNWGQSTLYAEIDVNGDNIIQYSNLNYEGIDFGSTVDASSMEYLHIDVWTADLAALDIFPISVATGEKAVTKNLIADQWVSFDIPLSDFTDQGLSMADIFQFKFVGATLPDGELGTVFLDNIYFYKPSSIPTEPVVAAPSPTAPEGNVVSIFSNAYTNVTLSELNPDWGQSTTLTSVNVQGNSTWLYEDLNYSGIVTDYSNPTDLSGMTFVHFDYFTPDATTVGLKLVNTTKNDGDPLKEDIEYVSSVTLGTWVSVDIPLSVYTTDISAITQIIFESSSAKVYIDNLYFYTNGDGTAPTVAATSPTINQSGVVSIFSDTYTSVALNEVNPNWGQSTTLATIQIGGNNVWLYESLNYTGIVTDYNNPTNLAGFKYAHFDYFTPDATTLGLKLVNTTKGDGDPLKEDIEYVSSITKGTWVSVDIPLANYTTDVSAVTQLIFESSGAKVYIDNFYFHN